ncbi:MAG: hypothetical protein OXD31_08385 [Chloroflexi bacterium]|nr:hypothetical protein [Chloroflexota bacterium]
MTLTGTTRWLALLGIVLALPALLMACGGDEPDAGEGAASTPRTEAATATAAPQPTATTAPLLTIGPTSAETDREALVALYNATDGPGWNIGIDGNWLTDAPLDEWYGVFTDDSGRVTSLLLGANNLSGEIPPELGSLANLRLLRLGSNDLSGEMPTELGSLANLEVLRLYENRLSGEIPPELSNLANLAYMELGDNQLSGEIPPELGILANLKGLRLDENQLSGEIPPELGNLANLENLYLSDNQLSGCVPSSLQGQLDMTYSDLGGLPFCP